MVPHMWVTAGEVLGGPEENRNLPTTWRRDQGEVRSPEDMERRDLGVMDSSGGHIIPVHGEGSCPRSRALTFSLV